MSDLTIKERIILLAFSLSFPLCLYLCFPDIELTLYDFIGININNTLTIIFFHYIICTIVIIIGREEDRRYYSAIKQR